MQFSFDKSKSNTTKKLVWWTYYLDDFEQELTKKQRKRYQTRIRRRYLKKDLNEQLRIVN